MDFSTPRSGKRARSSSISSNSTTTSNLDSEDGSPGPFNKILRSAPTESAPTETIECSLPPTCFPTPQTFSSVSELDRHQLAFHTFICRTPVRDKAGSSSTNPTAKGSGGNGAAAGGIWDLPREFTSRNGGDRWKECRKVFPDQRLLDLVSLSIMCSPHPRHGFDAEDIDVSWLSALSLTSV